MSMFSDGKIRADTWKFELKSDTVEEGFLSSEIKDDIHSLVSNGDYRSYYTSPYEVCGRLFAFRVFFEKGLLISVTLSPASKVPSWDSVEKDTLLKDKEENEEWLKSSFSMAAPHEFTWGTLESVLDKKGGSSTLVIRFKR